MTRVYVLCSTVATSIRQVIVSYGEQTTAPHKVHCVADVSRFNIILFLVRMYMIVVNIETGTICMAMCIGTDVHVLWLYVTCYVTLCIL